MEWDRDSQMYPMGQQGHQVRPGEEGQREWELVL